MKRFVWLGSVVVLVVLLWSGAWFGLSSYIRSNVEALALADALASPRLSCEDLAITGFPFRFDLACRGTAIQQGDLLVRAPEVRASVLVYRPTHVQMSAKSPISFDDAFTGSRSEIAFSDLALSASLSGWRIGRVSLVGNGVAWNDTLFAPTLIAGAAHLEAHVLDIPERHDPDNGRAALAAYITATEIAASLLALSATNTEIEAEIDGLPDDVRELTAPEPLRTWQARGGKLTLVSVKASEGEDFVQGAGTLALDAAGRLEGQVQFTSKGLAERTEALIEEPWRSIFVGQPDGSGSFRQTLAFRAGLIFGGLVPLGAVPPLY